MNSKDLTKKYYSHMYKNGYMCIMNELVEFYQPEKAKTFMSNVYGIDVKVEDIYYGELLPAYDVFGRVIKDEFLHPVFVKLTGDNNGKL